MSHSSDPYLAPGARNDELAAEPPPPPPGPAGASDGGRPPVVLGEALVVRPGDALILRIDPHNGVETARQFAADAKALLPETGIALNEAYVSFLAAGFDRRQALYLTACIPRAPEPPTNNETGGKK